eukprot:TRINITY_DN6473_c1_g1_i1.p1 TRINITY_DN6473_c1_g1~~TRINITY_DN6473_c1_g1_i1.p1  ORF type:complete len:856 (+),score=174.44 TRINITY_DN6473_c1_g1_i1:336-2570(+)
MKSCSTKHTTNLRVNAPQFDNQLDTNTLKTLYFELSKSVTSLDKRITMIGACQNGNTEWWCKGSPTAELAKSLRWLVHPPTPPTQDMDTDRRNQVKRIAEVLISQRNTPNTDVEREEVAVHGSLQGNPDDGGESIRLLHTAHKQAKWVATHSAAISTSSKLATPQAVENVSENIRWGLRLVSALASGDSPTLSMVNGKAHNIGAGMAVLCNFAALRNEAELTYSGAAAGTTPIGGLVRLLTDPSCDLKYPGLAEYITLTGDILCYGDARRLGWTAVHAPTDVHLNERMVHDYMNMHGPGQGRYAKRILDNLLFNDTDISPDQDRCSISSAKASWIRDAFEGKETMTDIITTLTEMSEDDSPQPEEQTDIVGTATMPTDNSNNNTHQVGKLVITRQQWATYLLQLFNSYSPMALSVTLAMVHKARAERLSLEECLTLEFRCYMRMVGRSDFVVSQICSGAIKDAEWPITAADWDVKNSRPLWSPATLDEVSASEVKRIVDTPLDWKVDGTTELNVSVEKNGRAGIRKAADHHGIDVVPGLGSDPSVSTTSNAYLPKNINIYRTARHPQTGSISSEREDTIPVAQKEYKEQVLSEASDRIQRGLGRKFTRDSELVTDYKMYDFNETEREQKVREGKLLWDRHRMAAEFASNPETARFIEKGIDIGGEAVLSPGGAARHRDPSTGRHNPVFGDIPDHRSSILTHAYTGQGFPKQVRNWDLANQFTTRERAKGTPQDQIASMIIQNDF